MSRQIMIALFGTIILGMTVAVHAQNYGAGSCQFPNTQMFPTIQAAVNAVPAGSTISVCPGVYPEQVTISQPLTLQGRAFGNASRATIVLAPGASLNWNALIYNDVYLYAQVLVQNVNPPGPVNIIGITVDGNGAVSGSTFPYGCFDPNSTGSIVGLAGILYDQGATGTVNEVSTRNQKLSGCGFGIVAFNGSGAENITIENSSVHDVDDGITTFGFSNVGSAPTLTATVHANFVTAGNGYFAGVESLQASASLNDNFVTAQGEGIRIDDYPSTLANNTVADSAVGVFLYQPAASTAQSNRLSDVGTGFSILSGASPGQLWPAPTIQGNLVQNTSHGVDFGGVSCPSGLVIDKNTFNDSALGFNGTPATLGGANQIENVDTIQNTGPCP